MWWGTGNSCRSAGAIQGPESAPPSWARAADIRGGAAVSSDRGRAAPTAAALGLDAVFVDARRRVAVVFKLNIALSLAAAVTLLGATIAAIVLGFLGRDVWASALGGVALLDLVGAAIYRPLGQINRALGRSERLDIIMLSTRERFMMIEEIESVDKRIAAAKEALADVVADLEELDKR